MLISAMETQSVKKVIRRICNTIWSKGLKKAHYSESLELKSKNPNYIKNPTQTTNPNGIRIDQSINQVYEGV